MINNLPTNCCGCSACEWVCPHKAIRMVSDSLGFSLPSVNTEDCINCGLCESVCPFFSNNNKHNNDGFPITYAARNKEIHEIETSRSGGVFTALSTYIIDIGGVVYGAAFSNKSVVTHQKAENYIELSKFKGSKYTQSDIKGIISDLQNELSSGRPVLFSGTPCQTSAIRNLMSRKYTNLYLVDVICHGVVSPKVWSDYIQYIEKKERKKVVKADFRDKSIFGWDGLHRESFIFDNNIKHTYPVTFYQSFLIRESCSSCPYSSIKRATDLTLGDLWGWEKICSDLNKDKKGISLVLVNSQKGAKLLDNIAKDLHLKEISLDKCMQPNLINPTPRDKFAEEFKDDYVSKGFDYVLKKYYTVTLTEKVRYKIKRILGKA